MMEGSGSRSVPLTNESGTLLQGVKIILGYGTSYLWYGMILYRNIVPTVRYRYFLRTFGVVSELSILSLT
jgi:hypothetical protein